MSKTFLINQFTMECFWFLFFLTISVVAETSSQGMTIVNLNQRSKHFHQNITQYQLFCVDMIPKTCDKMWSSASVSFKKLFYKI